MFLSLAKLFADGGGSREQVLQLHPIQLSRWLEEAWSGARRVPELPIGSTSTSAPFLGEERIIGALDLPIQVPPPFLQASGILPPDSETWRDAPEPSTAGGVGLIWHHLVYAYLIESTGAFEVFSEVVRRLVVGETLGKLSPEGHTWLRSTEELFFRSPPLFSITGVESEARPQARVNRRNAYWRMFGLDLPHPLPAWPEGGGDRRDWRAHVGLGINTDFRPTWSELLRQVWLGLENSANSSGANPTDPAYVALLCKTIKDSLNNRRQGGLLGREEFVYVSVLSWFHLTLQTDTPIVNDLDANATSPADRLARLAERVGMAPAARSRELFDLSEPMSSVLRAIELGTFDDQTAAATLFADGTPLGVDMRNIINQWQSATGERVKERPTGSTIPVSAQPLRAPSPATSSAASAAFAPPPPPPASAPRLPVTTFQPVPAGAGASNGSAR